MSFTVSDALALSGLQYAQALTQSSTRTCLVRGVAVIEVPVETFVREGDLVLSSAMGVGHDEALLVQFIEEIAASGAAALVISVGVYVHVVPQKVIAAAEARGLPLLTLPWKVRLSDVIEAVLRELIRVQTERSRRDDVVWSLATGGYASIEQARFRAQQFGYDLSRSYAAVFGQLHTGNDDEQEIGRAAEYVLAIAEDVAYSRV